MTEMTTRTVLAVEFLDYETATRSGRDRIREILATVQRLLAPALAAPGSVALPAMGGVRLVAVDGATRAVVLAAALAKDADAGGTAVRCALHTGDLWFEGGRAAGAALEIAEAMLDKVAPGEVWFGGTTRSVMMEAEVAWEDAGVWRFRGVPWPIRTCRVVPEGRCALPDEVAGAIHRGTLAVVRPGSPPPPLTGDTVVVLAGFRFDADLMEAVDRLPGVRPNRLFALADRIDAGAREHWTVEQGRGLVIGTLAAFEAVVGGGHPRASGEDHIVLPDPPASDLELRIVGLALLRCPVLDRFAGYTMTLREDGLWRHGDAGELVAVEVSEAGARLRVLGPDVSVDGRSCDQGEVLPLDRPAEIRTRAGPMRFVPAGRRYLGAFLADTDMVIPCADGDTFVGREPNFPGLALADRRSTALVVYTTSELGDRARSEGATIDRLTTAPTIGHVHREGDEVELHVTQEETPLYASEGPEGPVEDVMFDFTRRLSPGDHLWAGLTVMRFGPAPRS